MTHLSITEGSPHWGDHVTADEYNTKKQQSTQRPTKEEEIFL